MIFLKSSPSAWASNSASAGNFLFFVPCLTFLNSCIASLLKFVEYKSRGSSRSQDFRKETKITRAETKINEESRTSTKISEQRSENSPKATKILEQKRKVPKINEESRIPTKITEQRGKNFLKAEAMFSSQKNERF